MAPRRRNTPHNNRKDRERRSRKSSAHHRGYTGIWNPLSQDSPKSDLPFSPLIRKIDLFPIYPPLQPRLVGKDPPDPGDTSSRKDNKKGTPIEVTSTLLVKHREREISDNLPEALQRGGLDNPGDKPLMFLRPLQKGKFLGLEEQSQEEDREENPEDGDNQDDIFIEGVTFMLRTHTTARDSLVFEYQTVWSRVKYLFNSISHTNISNKPVSFFEENFKEQFETLNSLAEQIKGYYEIFDGFYNTIA